MKLIELLAPGEVVSGEKLAKELGISRAAIHKQVEVLRKNGYVIDAGRNSGYKLVSSADLLSPAEIGKHLKDSAGTYKFFYSQKLSSTQEKAKKLAAGGAPEWSVVIAESQSSGRGRMGREWHSPEGGIWMSIVLKPLMHPDEVPQLTLVASLALCETADSLLNIKTGIKWPNDVFAGDKKAAGILTEISAEIGKVNWVVIGIGINANNPVPAQVRATASSLSNVCGRKIDRAGFTAAFLEKFREYAKILLTLGFSQFMSAYNGRSVLNGKNVTVNDGKYVTKGRASLVDKNGFLWIETLDGKTERILAGDVTLE